MLEAIGSRRGWSWRGQSAPLAQGSPGKIQTCLLAILLHRFDGCAMRIYYPFKQKIVYLIIMRTHTHTHTIPCTTIFKTNKGFRPGTEQRPWSGAASGWITALPLLNTAVLSRQLNLSKPHCPNLYKGGYEQCLSLGQGTR